MTEPLGPAGESAEELYEHAPCGYITTRPDGTIVRVNATFLDWTGYAREELVGRRFQDLLTAPGRMYHETHYAPLLRLQGWVRELALDLRCARGRTLPALVNSVQRRDGDGAPGPVLTTIFDATERRRYERDLLEARRRAEQLAEVVHLAGDAIIIAGPDGTVRTWNLGAERLFGWTAAEATGRRVQELIVPPDQAEELERAMRELREGRELQLETTRRHRDGTRLDVSLRLTPHVEPPGEIVAISAIIRDITERKRVAERLRQAEQLQAVGTLAGGVAHEVNNQMTAVLGFGELVLKELGAAHPQASDVQYMVDAAARAARITQQLLAFSRRQPLAPRVLDVHEVVTGLAPVLIRLLGADKALVIRPRPARRKVRADPTQLEQILINLAANARDAMETAGRLTIATDDVALEADDRRVPGTDLVEPGAYVLLTVADTGHGMDAATLAHAFEPFFTTKPVGQGTGLGLPTVYGIVRQHEGHVVLESTPGRGTTVRVYLPAHAEGAAGPADAAPAASAPLAHPARVLRVEDDAMLRTLARRILQSDGIEVLEAADGAEALQVLAEAWPVDVVVTDLIMPEMNGHQLGTAIAGRWPGLPVLYTSAYAGDEMRARGMLPEGAPFLQKPFVPDALLEEVRALLRLVRGEVSER